MLTVYLHDGTELRLSRARHVVVPAAPQARGSALLLAADGRALARLPQDQIRAYRQDAAEPVAWPGARMPERPAGGPGR
jgi:hypothetical protein